MITKIFKLVLICFIVFVLLQVIGIIIYETLTEKYMTSYMIEHIEHIEVSQQMTKEALAAYQGKFSAPLIAKSAVLFSQGLLVFCVSYLIGIRKKYEPRYWLSALVITVLVYNLGDTTLSYSSSYIEFSVLFLSSAVIAFFANYLSRVLINRTSKSQNYES